MSTHRRRRHAAGPRRPWVRTILAAGLVLGLGSLSTMASWSDDATLTPGPIQSGSLDLLINGNLAGLGGSTTSPSMSLASMVPGESVAVTVPVQRGADTVGFTYTASATATGGLASYLQWTVTVGSAGTPATNANGIRTNSCSGTALSSNVTLSGTATNVIAVARSLASATSENICIRAELPSGTANAAQGLSATASFVFNATQLS